MSVKGKNIPVGSLFTSLDNPSIWYFKSNLGTIVLYSSHSNLWENYHNIYDENEFNIHASNIKLETLTENLEKAQRKLAVEYISKLRKSSHLGVFDQDTLDYLIKLLMGTNLYTQWKQELAAAKINEEEV